MRWALALVVVFGIGADVHAQLRQAQPVTLDQPSLALLAPAPLDVHEWGVWRLRGGQLDHLADLVRESPAFVHRVGDAPLPPTPRLPETIEIALKPVVFLRADTALDVTVTVEMPGGQPWLYFPDGIAGETEAPVARTVRWSGRVLPVSGRLPQGVSYPMAPAGHWWNAIRGANASPFVPTGATLAERFLFYDGPVPFRALWSRAGTSVAPVTLPGVGGARAAWVLTPNAVTRVTARGRRITRATLHDVDAVRAELRAALVSAGLDAAEAQSLLTTWDSELFRSAAPRAIWLLPRAEYDRMLPLTVTPRPRSLARVGVAIQLL